MIKEENQKINISVLNLQFYFLCKFEQNFLFQIFKSFVFKTNLFAKKHYKVLINWKMVHFKFSVV